MSPNVMSGCEWIHSIASAVVNHNAAAAPPMSEDGHCKDGCREYTCSCVGSKNTKILYLIIFPVALVFDSAELEFQNTACAHYPSLSTQKYKQA